MTTTRTDKPTAWDERSTLQTMLTYVRETAIAKCEGLSDELAGQAPLATSPLTSIGGFVNHLRWVEHSWFETVFLGEPDRGPWTDEEPDREMTLGAQGPLAQVLVRLPRPVPDDPTRSSPRTRSRTGPSAGCATATMPPCAGSCCT